jgi:hypothetical protein
VRRYEDEGVRFVGMAHQDSVEAMADFVARHDLGGIPHGVDQAGELWAHFEVLSQPNWLFVSASGEVSAHRGALGADALDKRIRAMTGPS